MTMAQHSVVVGVFSDRTHAEQAVSELHSLGLRDEQLGYVVPGEGGDKAKQAATGIGVGAVGGGVTGGLLGTGTSLHIPGVGPAVAGGILATTLGGLATGAAAGGISGALAKMGIPEEEARHLQSDLEAGRPLVTAEATTNQQEVRDVFQHCGASHVSAQPGLWGTIDQQQFPPAP